MTILFFSRLFYPHIGGVEKHVLEIGKRLVKKGYRVIVVAEYQSSVLSAKMAGEIEGMEIHRIPSRHSGKRSASRISNGSERFWTSQNDGRGVVGKDSWFKKFKIWWWLWRNRQLIKKADIVHCHDVFFWYLPFRFLYPNKPVYTTFHGYESYPIKKTAVIVRKISEKLSFGNICIGDYIKKWYGTKPTFVTYGGVDLKSQISNLKSQIHNSKLKILFVGRLDEQTGIKMYCDAVRMIKKKFPKIELTIAGDGPLRESAEKYGKVLGFISQPEKQFCDYRFAFVSRYLAILEALAAKRLVFAVYDNPVKRDYLLLSPFSRFIVSAGSGKQLADKLIWFINHPEEERKIIDRGFVFAMKQSWDNVVNKYIKLWSAH